MTKKSHLARHAGSALAAALALYATPILAQDISAAAPPPIDVAPTITVPDIAPATPPAVPQAEIPVDPAPVVTAEPVPAAPVVRETAPRAAAAPARTSAPAPRMAAAPAPVVETPEPAAPEPTAVEALPPVAAVPAPVLTDTPPVLAESPAAQADMTVPAVLGGLGALVLLGIGMVAFRRRTPPSKLAEPAPLEPETLQPRRAAAIVPTLPAALETTPAAPEPAPVVAETAPVYREPIAINRSAPAASLSHEGAAVALPREMPKTFEERDALMRRMIAAKPDRANPFKSPIQRYHRAKLIMQSLGRNFGDATPWIDLSQYPQNWPELQNRYATAA